MFDHRYVGGWFLFSVLSITFTNVVLDEISLSCDYKYIKVPCYSTILLCKLGYSLHIHTITYVK